MSNYLITEDGKYLGDVATNTGLKDLYDWLEDKEDEAVDRLLNDGTVEAPELYRLLDSEKGSIISASLASTVDNLLRLLKGVRAEVIITDGVGEQGSPSEEDDLQYTTEEAYDQDDHQKLWDLYG